jgi:hypothetical protein
LISRRGGLPTSSPWQAIVIAGLNLGVLGFSGCGGDTRPETPKSEPKVVEAPKADAAPSKTTKSRFKNEAPNAGLGPRERRALKLKGQLPSN